MNELCMHIILALYTLWCLCTLLRSLQRSREDGSYRSSLLDWPGGFWYVLISWFTNCVWVLVNVIWVVFNLNTCLMLLWFTGRICRQFGMSTVHFRLEDFTVSRNSHRSNSCVWNDFSPWNSKVYCYLPMQLSWFVTNAAGWLSTINRSTLLILAAQNHYIPLFSIAISNSEHLVCFLLVKDTPKPYPL